MTIFSCQEPFEKVVPPNQEDGFMIDSSLSGYISAISLKDGSLDNIIDKGSCLSIILPVSVVANGVEINVSSVSDFVEIERLFDQYASEDTMEINFPITVENQYHQLITVASQEELDILVSNCIEDGLDEDIECVDFVYPVEILIYNTEVQKSRSLVIDSDKALHSAFVNLSPSDWVSFQFPIQIKIPDGSVITVMNLIELETIIANQENGCDEDDDFDFNDDDVDVSPVYDYLLGRNFEIAQYVNETDLTQSYKAFIIKFESNDSLFYSDKIVGENGRWRLFGDDGTIDLDFDFDSDSRLKELQDRWNYVNISDSLIQFEAPGSGEALKSLTLKISKKVPLILSEILTVGVWGVQQLLIDASDETTGFDGYTFIFNADGTANANDSQVVTDGSWMAIHDNTEQLLSLDFSSNSPYDLIREDWIINDFSEFEVDLVLKDNEGNVTSRLILIKV